MDPRTDLPYELPEGAFAVHPDGEPLRDPTSGGPLLWVSRTSPSPGLWATARAAHSATGYWPLLLTMPRDAEDGPSGWEDARNLAPGGAFEDVDVAAALEGSWNDSTEPEGGDHLEPEQRIAITAPFGTAWPGLAPSGDVDDRRADAIADGVAAEVVRESNTRLGLVRAASGAEALNALGWFAPVNHGFDPEDVVAVVADWERRFGARVVAASGATLTVSTAAAPTDRTRALRLAAELFAFCPDAVWQGTLAEDTLVAYADSLVGATTWSFWWD